jgi:hypothetical protein
MKVTQHFWLLKFRLSDLKTFQTKAVPSNDTNKCNKNVATCCFQGNDHKLLYMNSQYSYWSKSACDLLNSLIIPFVNHSPKMFFTIISSTYEPQNMQIHKLYDINSKTQSPSWTKIKHHTKGGNKIYHRNVSYS